MSDDFRRAGVDDGDSVARLIRAFIVDPQIFPVVLQGDPGRLYAGIDLSQHFPTGRLNHRHPSRVRHRDEEPLLVTAHYPVFTGTRQWNQSQELAAPETRKRIYYGNVRFVIQGQNEVAVEIKVRTPVEAGLQKRLHLLAALSCVRRGAGFFEIDPGRRVKPANRLTRIALGNLEAHRRVVAFAES